MGPGLCEAVALRTGREGRVSKSCRRLKQLDRVAVGVTQVDGGATVVDTGVDLHGIGDTPAAGSLGARERGGDVVHAKTDV
jgi:methenyltetrahydromethanopterin cyclohydrolase